MIQLDDVTRIKLAFRNQGQLAPFVCYLVFKMGNFAIDITEQKKIPSNCRKQLVTPVNLTRNFFLTNYLISRIGSELPKLKTAFYESHFPHCVWFEFLWIRRYVKMKKNAQKIRENIEVDEKKCFYVIYE